MGTQQTEFGDKGKLYDINNDGNLDMLVAGKTAGTEYQFLYRLGNGDGSFQATQEVGSGNRTSWGGGFNVGDLNGDGYAEVAVRLNTGGLEVFSFNGSNFSSQGTYTLSGGTGTVRSIGFVDTDNDGDDDIVMASDGNKINVFTNNTNAITTTTTTTTTTVPGDGRDFFPQIDLASQSAARTALDNVRLVQTSLAQAIGQLGAEQSRLFSAYQVIQTESLNVLDAGARIDNADIADVSAQNLGDQIRMQAAASISSQANQNGRLVLDFL